MRIELVLGLAGLVVLGGCAAAYEEPRPGANHPASVDAAAAPVRESGGLLEVSAAAPVGEARAAVPPGAGHGAHDHAAHEQSGLAQTPPAGETIYTCPMHPEVVSEEPGRCPECGMNLVVREGGR